MKNGNALVLCALLWAAAQAQEKKPGNFPFNNTTAVGAEQFLQAHPTYDGRGVVLAVLDCGVQLGIPGLVTTSDGKPKILDCRDFTGEGDVSMVKAKVVKEGGKDALALGKERWFGIGSLPFKAKGSYFLAVYSEKRLLNNSPRDLNGNGKTDDKWAFLVFRTAKGFWVVFPDTDMDHDFADEKALRDYVVRRDTFEFGPRDPKKQPTIMICSVTVRPEEKVLEVYAPTGAHGTHVAGMAAGYHMDGNPHHNGIAPGAQILALKIGDNSLSGGATVTGSMIKAYEYAVAWAKKRKMPLVFNMSYGVGSEIEGRSVMDRKLDRLFTENPTVLCSISNGNEGPGISNTGLPAASKRVWSAGAMMAVDTLAAVWGADIKTFKPFIFTSRGGEIPKPDGMAPGGASSTVPRYLKRDAMWGTSMASPQTAGFMCCLASACLQEKIPYTNMVFYRAMRNAAKPLPGWNELDQGAGLIQMSKTFEYLKEYAARKESEKIYAYDIQAEADSMPGGKGRAAYFRAAHWFPAYPDTTTFRVTPVFPKNFTPDQKIEFYRAYDLVPQKSWIRIDKPSAYIKGTSPLILKVWYDKESLKKPGLYVGSIYAYRKDLPHKPENIEFRLLNTVVVPFTLSAENHFTLEAVEREVAPGDIHRYFVDVPAGMQSLNTRLTSPEGKFCRALISIFSPTGEEAASWVPKVEKRPGPVYNQVLGRKLYPGVWEIVVWGYYQNRETSIYNLRVQAGGFKSVPRELESFTYKHPNPPSGKFKVVDLVNRIFEGNVQGETLGYSRTIEPVISSTKWVYTFRMPKGVQRVRFALELTKRDFNLFTDFGVQIRDSRGKVLTQGGFSYHDLAMEIPNDGSGRPLSLVLIPGFADKRPRPFKVKIREEYYTAKRITIKVGPVKIYPYVPTELSFFLSEPPVPVPEGYLPMGQILFRDAAENQIQGFVPVRFQVGLVKKKR